MIITLIFSFFITISHDWCLEGVIIEYDQISLVIIYSDFGCIFSDVVVMFSCMFKFIYFWSSYRLFTLIYTAFDFGFFSWIYFDRYLHVSWPLSLSRSFYLLCLAKGVFSPVPPYRGYLKPSHFFVIMCMYLVSPYCSGHKVLVERSHCLLAQNSPHLD